MQQARLEKIDPKRNMQRYYDLEIVPTLFGGFALVRHWGRLGRKGQSRSHFYLSETEALGALKRWAALKERRGYTLLQPEGNETALPLTASTASSSNTPSITSW